MNVVDAARIFHDWAVTEGIPPESPVAPSSSPSDLAMLAMTSEEGKALLRKQRVLSVGFNEDAHEVIVFTRLAAPASKKRLSLVPNSLGDVDIVYRQGMHTLVGDELPAPHAGPPYIIRTTTRGNRYACGSSISAGNQRDAGTLSCLVKDAAGVLYGLTNNHVAGGCSYAEVDLPVLAPGVIDVAPKNVAPFTLGFHSKTLPFKAGSPSVVDISSNSDAAIFRIAHADLVTSFQGNIYDTPQGSATLTAGMPVEKVGRTTGHTAGVVVSQLYGPVPVSYQSQVHNFSGQIFFDPLFVIAGTNTLFSENGDSGSLITSLDPSGNRVAVGVVIAGMNDSKAPGGRTTLALPIEPILSALGVTLVSGHNT
jgi:hypothetical protein